MTPPSPVQGNTCLVLSAQTSPALPTAESSESRASEVPAASWRTRRSQHPQLKTGVDTYFAWQQATWPCLLTASPFSLGKIAAYLNQNAARHLWHGAGRKRLDQ